MYIFRRKTSYSLLRICLLLLLIETCLAQLFAKSEPCKDVNGVELNCPHNFIYYFECCANECCLRTQVLPAILIGIAAVIMTCFCLVSCVAYCCCGE
ncbi:hypothetical protein GCK72_015458 [Caenorhabditis remanei]|uniref:CX domain-containing protein n=2 Tax=Caenorhabditis remanei TaxID=31234 RepID=A0A6A5GU45_CAERE|nr:hypothetical protein GCK72_015458 [Caenorhabditis remanei]KAF1758998.1 hypothetical protein GCK72_015458 [Caenorhabditis remanei]